MAKWGVSYKPRDLPMTTTVCTNCGQWLDFEEAIEGAMLPDCGPKDSVAWAAWMNGASADDTEWVCFCPRCDVNLADKPPRDVIIRYADEISECENVEDIRTTYIKNQCVSLLEACEETKSSAEKGRLLERLTELIFTSKNCLQLMRKRVSTGDEEIDLVVKNNVERPFWLAFNSPLFFIECKNWNDPVGAKELRDFEIKLQNHARLAKLGFFVAMNGFTKEVYNELKRCGREDYHIVLIDRSAIDEYLLSETDFFVWLEGRTATFH